MFTGKTHRKRAALESLLRSLPISTLFLRIRIYMLMCLLENCLRGLYIWGVLMPSPCRTHIPLTLKVKAQ